MPQVVGGAAASAWRPLSTIDLPGLAGHGAEPAIPLHRPAISTSLRGIVPCRLGTGEPWGSSGLVRDKGANRA